jgi:hypothetical protein
LYDLTGLRQGSWRDTESRQWRTEGGEGAPNAIGVVGRAVNPKVEVLCASWYAMDGHGVCTHDEEPSTGLAKRFEQVEPVVCHRIRRTRIGMSDRR